MTTEREKLAAKIGEGLDRPGKTQAALAKLLGIKQPRISEILSCNRQVKATELPIIARYLEMPELISETPKVNVVGYVGAGAEIYSIDDLPKGGSLEEGGIDGPPGTSHSTVAVFVRGDSMWPVYSDGDVIFYDEHYTGDLTELIGKECIVRVADGRTFIKRLARGSTDGVWTLTSYNAPPVVDVVLDWIAKVRWIERK